MFEQNNGKWSLCTCLLIMFILLRKFTNTCDLCAASVEWEQCNVDDSDSVDRTATIIL